MSESTLIKVEHLIMGSIMTGVAVVIGRSWGGLIQTIVRQQIIKFKCKDKKGEELKHCQGDERITIMAINALCTTLILILVTFLFFVLGVRKIK